MLLYFLLSALSILLFLIVEVTSWGNILNYPEYVRSVEQQWDLTNLALIVGLSARSTRTSSNKK